ncbi:MAG: hypothetical protein H6613_08420 [Ignavibacteriales bacterium]|nr:hypothetical protein [Ignavibacteriales bacterium]
MDNSEVNGSTITERSIEITDVDINVVNTIFFVVPNWMFRHTSATLPC